MDSVRSITTIWLALFLSLGIGIASLFPNNLFFAAIALLVSLGYAFVALIFQYKKPKIPLGLRNLLFLCTFLIGYILYLLHLPANQPRHITHFHKVSNKEWLHVEFLENLRTTSYYQQYIVNVKQVNQEPTFGKVLLRIRTQDSLDIFEPGQEKLLYTNLHVLANPANPFDIDMRKYYRSLGIFHSVIINKRDTILAIASKPKRSWVLRKKALDALENTSLHNNSKQLIQAMVLGYRDEWSSERRIQYSNAGVAHILAISGLHVGIIYLALFWLALPLQRIWLNRTPVYVLCIIGLWWYAWFTGMSPSVTRSVSMLSFFVIARLVNRPAPPLHTLASSYLVLLLLKPEWLFHVGFQMSYTAVFFILWLYPRVKAIWTPRNGIIKRIWQVVIISCIAQLGVMPWTLHYFGKIPGLFLLSNLVVFSLVSVLLIGGILLLLLSLLGVSKGWLFLGYDFLTQQIDNYILWVSKQHQWILTVSKPSIAISLALYLLLLFGLPVLWNNSYRNLRNLSIAGLLFISVVTISKLNQNKEEVWLLQQIGESLILHTTPKNIQLFTNNTTVDSTYLWTSLSAKYIDKKIHKRNFLRSFKIGQQLYIQIDSTAIYSKNIPKGSIVMLQQSAKVNLDKLISEIRPKLIIADASNYPSRIEQWRETCIETETPFLSTSEKGAILLKSNSFLFKTYLEMTSDNLAKPGLK